MIGLATVDEPDVLCLQELPLWALDHLDRWSGMRALADVAAPARLGPLPSTAEIGAAITQLHHGFFRSAFTGQANAILVSPRFRVLSRSRLALNDRSFRRIQARWLRLPAATRLAWAKERRVCQAVRLADPDGGTLLIANLHATGYRPDERLADAEVFRAAVYADALAHPDEVLVLAGDFNVRASRSWTLTELTGPEWGFSGLGPWIDHILVRGAPVGPVQGWPEERRLRAGFLLSDHAPVDAQVG